MTYATPQTAQPGDTVIRQYGNRLHTYRVERVTRTRIVVASHAYKREDGSPTSMPGYSKGSGWIVTPTPDVLEALEKQRADYRKQQKARQQYEQNRRERFATYCYRAAEAIASAHENAGVDHAALLFATWAGHYAVGNWDESDPDYVLEELRP